MWWVGWELNTFSDWNIVDFLALVIGSISIYGAAELALPSENFDIADDSELDFIQHSRSLGRISALSMLGYFSVGPHVNITLFGNPPLPSIGIPLLGGILMLLIALKLALFKVLSVLFACYTVLILYLTA